MIVDLAATAVFWTVLVTGAVVLAVVAVALLDLAHTRWVERRAARRLQLLAREERARHRVAAGELRAVAARAPDAPDDFMADFDAELEKILAEGWAW